MKNQNVSMNKQLITKKEKNLKALQEAGGRRAGQVVMTGMVNDNEKV